MLDSRTRDERSERLAWVEEHARQRMKPEDRDAVQAFVRAFYANVSDDDVLALPAESLYGAALAVWKFSARRVPGRPRIRAYNPRVEEHGWQSVHTIIEIVNDDMPFLVDSVTGYLNQHGLNVRLVIHPVIDVRRDAEGERIGLADDPDRGGDVARESIMHVQIDQQDDSDVHSRIVTDLQAVLSDVRAAVEDWPVMLDRLGEVVDELEAGNLPVDRQELDEAGAFLAWMRDDHFTFLGCRDYRYGKDGKEETLVVADSGLGILRDAHRHVLTPPQMPSDDDVTPIVRQFIRRPELLLITKTSVRGTVHRPVHMDYIGVKRYAEDGSLAGERRFVGLFTASAYNRTPRDIPLLRRKVARALSLTGLDPEGHDGKALTHILETYPRDELWQIDEQTLAEIASGILAIQERPHIRLFARRDTFDRYYSVLVFVPRDKFSTELRLRFEEILTSSLNGRISNYFTQVGDSPLARLHYIVGIDPPGPPQDVDYNAIEQRLIQAARTWQDDLCDALSERWGEPEAARLAARYGPAFPPSYCDFFNIDLALNDIERIERLLQEPASDVAFDLYRLIEDPEYAVRLKIFSTGEAVPLSDCLPMLENMGLKVIGETPHRLAFGGDKAVWIHDFYMETPGREDIELSVHKATFEAAFDRIWRDQVEDDGFNRLVLTAGLNWRQIVVLRAMCKYLRQTGIAFSQSYMEDTLANNPVVTRRIVDLFAARFDPGGAGREAAEPRLVEDIEADLERVASLDEDRILRRFVNLVRSTLRTNYYQTFEGQPKSYLSLKFDSQKVEELPLPRPFREIFVYSPRVEGVHLRGGKVARGGLRWSDRREDFRTEVLGLMKAQMVKNAVIVPVGSKGGFAPKRLPSGNDREAITAEAVECYKIFIRGLLDLTDNRFGAEIVPPKDVVRYDDDDPYLVVAADKGTATFSDIANSVAIEYGFWLGDAFASGGAKGYDHKKMGITARGAWESVKRHFREMGRNIQSEPFTVVGIGDMSGDVFGNGMLLSHQTKLLAAFDHRNIFVDPDPDPDRSWHERKRLFDLPRSSWEDYDKSLISKGGGIFDRKAKAIELTAELRQLSGLDASRVTPNELISALLRADVDLLWFGGIGTYVKGAHESHAAVGDRANDSIRVDARELRCRVIGEGGNLGITQLGRIEFALAGGAINTDAVDNSGGVDCSDHEVNIKILLDAVVAEGELTGKQRDRLLADMTDEVANLVLQDNYLQTQTISVIASRADMLLNSHARFIRLLERQGHLNRAVEFLPDEEQIAERSAAGIGLTRPELSVLVAYAKMSLYQLLLDSDLRHSRALNQDLVKYFPRQLRRRFRSAIRNHRLRDEIISTVTANSIVNRLGITFFHDVMEETGQNPSAVARSYSAARELFKMREVWNAIEALDNAVPASTQTRMIVASADLMRRATLWLLRNVEQPLRITRVLKEFGEGVDELTGTLPGILSESEAGSFAAVVEELAESGVPAELAGRVAGLRFVVSACDIVQVAGECQRPVADVGRAYYALGADLGLDRLRNEAESLVTDDHWQRSAIVSIIEDLYGQQRALTNVVLSQANGAPGEEAVADWCRQHESDVRRSTEMLEEFEAAGGLDIAKLALANRYMRRLITFPQ